MGLSLVKWELLLVSMRCSKALLSMLKRKLFFLLLPFLPCACAQPEGISIHIGEPASDDSSLKTWKCLHWRTWVLKDFPGLQPQHPSPELPSGILDLFGRQACRRKPPNAHKPHISGRESSVVSIDSMLTGHWPVPGSVLTGRSAEHQESSRSWIGSDKNK